MDEKNLTLADLDAYNIPEHVAIILDGNGRWAQRRGIERTQGHVAGAENIYKIVQTAEEAGIKYLTGYAFSTENWNRPVKEVRFLMELIFKLFTKYLPEIKKSNIKVRVMGDRSGIPKNVLAVIKKVEDITKDHTGMQAILAFNYGGRREIVQATQQIAQAVQAGELSVEDIDEDIFASYIYLPDVPDADLIIRPSGERRISNFLLWRGAYAEFWGADVLWPDFSESDLVQAIIDFNERDRRFGGLNDTDKQ